MSTQSYTLASGSFGALASAFVIDSLGSIIIWIMVMAAVIFADLIAGIARSFKENVKIRFSKACRETISKAIVYFSLVVCTSMIQVAMGDYFEINKFACLFVIIIELSSVANNILGWHNMSLNFNKLLALLIKKKFDADTEDIQDIIISHGRDKKGRFAKRRK